MAIEIRAASVRDADDLARLLADVDWGDGPVIVKPNWFSNDPGNYTEARVLDLVLEVLPRPAIVVEAYTGPRDYGGRDDIPPDVAGAKAHRAWIAAQDRRWLATSGMDTAFMRHDAEYVNVTEAVWDGRVAPAGEVQAIVEERFGPAPFPELYHYVPQRLFDLRGSVLLSLARIKGAFSLSSKNLFGLIPDPLRLRWHGQNDSDLGASIISHESDLRGLVPRGGAVRGNLDVRALSRPGGHPGAVGAVRRRRGAGGGRVGHASAVAGRVRGPAGGGVPGRRARPGRAGRARGRL